MNQGWRWVFIISGIPGILLGILIFITVKEPERNKSGDEDSEKDVKKMLLVTRNSMCGKLGQLLRPFARPSLLMLCLAGSIRNGGIMPVAIFKVWALL